MSANLCSTCGRPLAPDRRRMDMAPHCPHCRFVQGAYAGNGDDKEQEWRVVHFDESGVLGTVKGQGDVITSVVPGISWSRDEALDQLRRDRDDLLAALEAMVNRCRCQYEWSKTREPEGACSECRTQRGIIRRVKGTP